jgi:Uma2 family endonuclease
MSSSAIYDSPPSAGQLAERWRALCEDPTFEDLAAKIELTEWGEILMSPVGKTHGLLAWRTGDVLRSALGGRIMVEVGIATDVGIRAPDVAWCLEAYLAAHPEEAPLAAAPELCIEVFSSANSLPKLREKALAYVRAGAKEGWILIPATRTVEVYDAGGRRPATQFPVDVAKVFEE